MTALTLVRNYACFGGTVEFYRHESTSCRSSMNFSVYQPPQAKSESIPVLYFLSGLTCTEENFMAKAGAQRYAAEHGVLLVVPDTSPRNTGIPGEDEDWELGSGAGFYLDATMDPWKAHYQMYRYIVEELPALIADHFPIQPDRQGICGHSMGGHGALICGLRNRDRYRSISAVAPVVAPMQCPWGQKAFSTYLGPDFEAWKSYDASQLVRAIPDDPRPILIDQGEADAFLKEQLKPWVFEQACAQVGRSLTLRLHPTYDHSYYFIATVIGEHIRYHAERLWTETEAGL